MTATDQLADRVAEAEARYWVFKKARYQDAPGRAFTDAVDGYLNRVSDRIRGESARERARLEARIARLEQAWRDLDAVMALTEADDPALTIAGLVRNRARAVLGEEATE